MLEFVAAEAAQCSAAGEESFCLWQLPGLPLPLQLLMVSLLSSQPLI